MREDTLILKATHHKELKATDKSTL